MQLLRRLRSESRNTSIHLSWQSSWKTMPSKLSFLSPLEQWFGIRLPEIGHNNKALNSTQSVSNNRFNSYNMRKELRSKSNENSENISRADENTHIVDSNTERNIRRNNTFSTPPPPPPPPLPPQLSALLVGVSDNDFPKTNCPQSPFPPSSGSSVGMEHLEKKLDLIHEMMLQLIQSVSQRKEGQQSVKSKQPYNCSSPSKVKTSKQLKESVEGVELSDIREKMMEELKIRLKQMSDRK
ncbi:hypothetical protein Gasu2_39340 [Galdieria sulphuraria]|uniref:Uncharacterized protein n=1 Tax=Galdieria sulphuraria TaxID=130081 RepID=M2W8R7_GALSU|nr:uncharacterized protein Gasu_06750 [Galdieria sulphuraria]EME32266.1 hypothetical protein Gasu_06750 [Galdieria sulphuraria]GJD09695.1 hypothetical protein Gasu2_39340 [Galdieria sulphuraria]|eukprot:XP_005708786.1 hypothetical protein Gasu_06750 [Galdieria sulphuraria]